MPLGARRTISSTVRPALRTAAAWPPMGLPDPGLTFTVSTPPATASAKARSAGLMASRALTCGVTGSVISLVSCPAHPSASSCTPRWVWASTRPGSTTLPVASTRSAASGTRRSRPTASIRPSEMRTTPAARGGPATGTTRPPTIANIPLRAVASKPPSFRRSPECARSAGQDRDAPALADRVDQQMAEAATGEGPCAAGLDVELLDVDPLEGAGAGDLEVPPAQPLEVAAVEGPYDAPGRGCPEPVARRRALAALDVPQGGGRIAGGLDRRRRRGRGRAGDGGGGHGGAGGRRRVHLLEPPPAEQGRDRGQPDDAGQDERPAAIEGRDGQVHGVLRRNANRYLGQSRNRRAPRPAVGSAVSRPPEEVTDDHHRVPALHRRRLERGQRRSDLRGPRPVFGPGGGQGRRRDSRGRPPGRGGRLRRLPGLVADAAGRAPADLPGRGRHPGAPV